MVVANVKSREWSEIIVGSVVSAPLKTSRVKPASGFVARSVWCRPIPHRLP